MNYNTRRIFFDRKKIEKKSQWNCFLLVRSRANGLCSHRFECKVVFAILLESQQVEAWWERGPGTSVQEVENGRRMNFHSSVCSERQNSSGPLCIHPLGQTAFTKHLLWGRFPAMVPSWKRQWKMGGGEQLSRRGNSGLCKRVQSGPHPPGKLFSESPQWKSRIENKPREVYSATIFKGRAFTVITFPGLSFPHLQPRAAANTSSQNCWKNQIGRCM